MLYFSDIGLEFDEPPKLLDEQPKQALKFGLFNLNEQQLKILPRIKTADIMVSSTSTPHPEGLYSVEYFGPTGSEDRKERYAYIDLKVPVITPIFYKNMLKAKSLYQDIMSGKVYAIYNNETNDFEPSDPIQGNTGYSFFMKHFLTLQFQETDSVARSTLIKFKEKEADKIILRHLIVMPPGLRELRVDKNGRVSEEDEISVLYGELVKLTNYVGEAYKTTPESYDGVAFRIQEKVLAIYDYIFGVTFDGKKKFALGKWGSRSVAYGTRGILGTLVVDSKRLGGETMVHPSQTVVGMYQFMEGAQPFVIYHLRRKLFDRIFNPDDMSCLVVNSKTMKSEYLQINQAELNYFTSRDGLEKLIGKFSMDSLRHQPVKVTNGHYLALVWRNEDSVVIVEHTDDLLSLGKGEISPMTYGEMFYFAIYENAESLVTQVTRYPVGSLGGTYPSLISLATTIQSKVMYEKDVSGGIVGKMLRYPIKGESFFNAFSPHTMHLGRLGGDHDGDMGSVNIFMADESIEEIKALRRKRHFYISPIGELTYSLGNDATDLAIKYMSDPRRF